MPIPNRSLTWPMEPLRLFQYPFTPIRRGQFRSAIKKSFFFVKSKNRVDIKTTIHTRDNDCMFTGLYDSPDKLKGQRKVTCGSLRKWTHFVYSDPNIFRTGWTRFDRSSRACSRDRCARRRRRDRWIDRDRRAPRDRWLFCCSWRVSLQAKVMTLLREAFGLISSISGRVVRQRNDWHGLSVDSQVDELKEKTDFSPMPHLTRFIYLDH